jgi:hypothetical protein
MFAEEFFIQKDFPHKNTIASWKDEKVWVGATI